LSVQLPERSLDYSRAAILRELQQFGPKGFPLRDVLDRAVPLSGAARVRFHGVDNYTDTIPLEKALEPTTLLAFEMNGAELPDRHGYPLRLIVPGYFGEKHVKWLTRIEVTNATGKGILRDTRLGPRFYHADKIEN
jgi:DMSO/TMAO reductase YedYZ molybdopterin-dependent catalytic subunit